MKSKSWLFSILIGLGISFSAHATLDMSQFTSLDKSGNYFMVTLNLQSMGHPSFETTTQPNEIEWRGFVGHALSGKLGTPPNGDLACTIIVQGMPGEKPDLEIFKRALPMQAQFNSNPETRLITVELVSNPNFQFRCARNQNPEHNSRITLEDILDALPIGALTIKQASWAKYQYEMNRPRLKN